MDFRNPFDIPEHELCNRCQVLNILQLFNEEMPWKTASELDKLHAGEQVCFRSLGSLDPFNFGVVALFDAAYSQLH